MAPAVIENTHLTYWTLLPHALLRALCLLREHLLVSFAGRAWGRRGGALDFCWAEAPPTCMSDSTEHVISIARPHGCLDDVQPPQKNSDALPHVHPEHEAHAALPVRGRRHTSAVLDAVQHVGAPQVFFNVLALVLCPSPRISVV